MAFLTPEQTRQLAAICDRLVPPGPDGPSASEAHVVAYIDGQLAGPWGQGARMYRSGPFTVPADAGHGWQSPLTPAEVYVAALAALERHTRARHGAPVDELPLAEQDDLIDAWSEGRVVGFEDTGVDAVAFFELVRQNTIEGMFCDPSYGGNHDMVGWRWLGYPGVASAHGSDYAEHVDRPGAYAVDPRPLRRAPTA
jgi:gluconate 2-dehydrogenase gamma chain